MGAATAWPTSSCKAGALRRCCAFTLIELLVVVSLLTALGSLALPTLRNARSAAHQARCLSNMRQLAIATQMYVYDYHGTYPQPSQDRDILDLHQRGSALWFNAVDFYANLPTLPYRNASERNYVAFKQDPVWESLSTQDNVQRDNRTIKMNAFFGKSTHAYADETLRWTREPSLHRPADTVLYFDGRAYDTPQPSTGDIDTSGATLFGAEEIYVGLRHSDGANVTFADAHARHHRDAIRRSTTGYHGWFAGTPDTNGFAGTGITRGPHHLFWRIDRE